MSDQQPPPPSQGNQPAGQWQQQMDTPRDAKARAKAEKAYAKAQRPWYKKKRFILPLLFLLLIIFIVAVSGGEDEPTDNGTAGTSQENEAPAGEEEAPADEGDGEAEEAAEPAFPGAQEDDVIGEAGAELTLGDVAITAGALEAGDDTFGETLCTAVTITNNADEAIDFNVFDWSLQEPGGTISMTGIAGSDDALSAGQIAPGGSTDGDVCFDVDDASESGQFVILYEPLFSFFSDRGAWLDER
ncbi:DUF4352 domain-containing protein [Ornithinimicrobium sediminis]|uniref:DUF4352 domain-containing protein n=1 Tax=Ornithinimicrobium sediminis TaxID=2904603 RepID=UPI001E3993B6|nr:DUF4352 domain-containing protein [Ornithinimicrobium sediminis]MCE0488292.1 DUF4352 domain-containing protein [Ornithinimicrobium sediminis]